MIARRLQLLGKSSLGVVLPKQYLDGSGVRKGDVLGLEILKDGSLRIIPLRNNHEGPPALEAGKPAVATPDASNEGGSEG